MPCFDILRIILSRRTLPYSLSISFSLIDYLTPNKTVARTREVDLLLDGFVVYLSIEDSATRKRITSILLSHGAFWYFQ